MLSYVGAAVALWIALDLLLLLLIGARSTHSSGNDDPDVP